MTSVLPQIYLVAACICLFFFFFNDTATTEIYTLSLHDALPIYLAGIRTEPQPDRGDGSCRPQPGRSEEHTSELQSRENLVCRLLLENKKIKRNPYSVVLLDEIEKAHPDIFNILLQVFEDGHLTDGLGNRVNFKNFFINKTATTGIYTLSLHDALPI